MSGPRDIRDFRQVLRDMGDVLIPLMGKEVVAGPLFRMNSGRYAFKMEMTWVYARDDMPTPPLPEPAVQKPGRRRLRRQRRQANAARRHHQQQQQQQQNDEGARRPGEANEPMEAISTPEPEARTTTGPPPGFVAPAGEGLLTSPRLGRPASPEALPQGLAAKPKKTSAVPIQPRTQVETGIIKPAIEEKKKGRGEEEKKRKKARTEEDLSMERPPVMDIQEFRKMPAQQQDEFLAYRNAVRAAHLSHYEKTGEVLERKSGTRMNEAEIPALD